MKIPKLITDYGRLNDASLNQKAIAVVDKLTDNADFPITTPTLIEFTRLQTAYADALTNTVTSDRQMIAIKNQKRAALLAGMRQLAMDIDALANGDKAMLLSCGFDLASPGDNSTIITNPTDFKILDGINDGELQFICRRVPNAISYIFQYTDELPTETTNWQMTPSSTSKLTFKGLRSGIKVYGRIKAVGRKGQEANSDVLSRIVQ